MRGTVIERFEAKYQPEPNTGCWLWLGASNPKGYGQLGISRKAQSAHRVSYEIYVGPIPEGKDIDHLCRNRACVNPAHLEPVSHHENVLRGELWKVQGTKTYCPRGHEYTDDNTYRYPRGNRACRRCRADQDRALKAARKTA